MNAVQRRVVRDFVHFIGSTCLLGVALVRPCIASPHSRTSERPAFHTVRVSLTEWKVQLTPTEVPSGPIVFEVTNAGRIPHAFEVEGRGLEQSTTRIRPGAGATLKLDLRPGSYEAYCPVGRGSHQMLGMTNHLVVGAARRASAP